jgi:hypothetical protein
MNFLKEEMERLKVERKQMNKGPQSTEIKGVSEGQIIFLLQLCTERRKETETTKEFRLPFRTILWLMKKKGSRRA